MTAISWMPPNTHLGNGQTSANVDAWMQDLFTRMESLDLTKTADTGQYSTSMTGVYDAMSSGGGMLGYQVYRLNDALADTKPLYIRLEILAYMGSKSMGFTVCSRVTVGTATDGAGNISENALTCATLVGGSFNHAITSAMYQSFASTIPDKGFIGVVFNAGIQWPEMGCTYAPVCFFIERIPNADGTPSDKGFTLFGTDANYDLGNGFFHQNSNYVNVPVIKAQTRVFATGTTITNTGGAPYFPQTALVGNNILLNHFYHSTPLPVRSACLSAIPAGVLGKGSQFASIVYGATETNFVAMDVAACLRPISSVNLNTAFAFE